jgi:hypothetical protein
MLKFSEEPTSIFKSQYCLTSARQNMVVMEKWNVTGQEPTFFFLILVPLRAIYFQLLYLTWYPCDYWVKLSECIATHSSPLASTNPKAIR